MPPRTQTQLPARTSVARIDQQKASLSSPKKIAIRKARSVRPLSSPLIAGEKLVGVGGPRDREQRQNCDDGQRFHGFHGRAGLWPKTSAICAFLGRSHETSWPSGPGYRYGRLMVPCRE